MKDASIYCHNTNKAFDLIQAPNKKKYFVNNKCDSFSYKNGLKAYLLVRRIQKIVRMKTNISETPTLSKILIIIAFTNTK
jgi:hypothetical protein